MTFLSRYNIVIFYNLQILTYWKTIPVAIVIKFIITW